MGTAHSRMEFEAFSGSVLGLPKQERSHEGYVSVPGRRPIGSVGASEHAGRHSSDEQILEYARTNNRVVCRLDADFHSIIEVSGSIRPSVVRIRSEGLRGPDVASILKRVWNEVGGAIDSGAAVTVTERSIRLRRLPIIADRDKADA